jgi:hypothetical protein
MSLREVILRDIERLRGEIAAAEAALRGYDGKGQARTAVPTAKVANRPSKRSIIAGMIQGKKRPELDAVMAELAKWDYPQDARARADASNVASKLLKAKKRK